MGSNLRQSMNWLHTWAGVVIGALLFVIFWMGTLSVFDREIDRWMMPATRLAPTALQQPFSYDAAARSAQPLVQGSPQWFVRPPTERVPAAELRWRNEATKTFERRYLHPQTGAVLAHTDTLAGTGFIFPFHFNLHIKWKDVGYWLVGVAGMAMLLLVVSGVVIHRKIFVDFFLFRPKKHLQRASLDLHNLTGVLGLPFHFMMALSGLVIFMNIYLPSAVYGPYAQEAKPKEAFFAEAYGSYKRAKADTPAATPPASLDAMTAIARREWNGSEPSFLRVWHPGDANSYVELRRSYEDAVTMNVDTLALDASTGAVLNRHVTAPVMGAQRFISGLHFIQFRHWTLRWLYFAAGLAGCIMIATGFLFWLEARRASHAKKGLAGVRVVEALSVASMPGIMAATMAFFIANRLLPLDAAWASWDRAALEMWAFYLVWLVMLAHAAWRAWPQDTRRTSMAWREQTWALAALAALAVALNWATTGHHLAHTLGQGITSVAGMDILLLALATGAALTARHLGRRAAQKDAALTNKKTASRDVRHAPGPSALPASGEPLGHA
ncbi:PepSY domain-containing protein [Polaromonas sp.]|uniref:PepSY-associated TM helix domain-containing protein n=1 Tax=Polaromonas sp. TaxID=1869339 RepID=UPI0025E4B42E|nr:PepSY-associated TM helix domain-containing protein [Polaromonas sp.]